MVLADAAFAFRADNRTQMSRAQPEKPFVVGAVRGYISCGGVDRAANPREAIMADVQRDVIEVLEHDHREVEAMFAELEALRGASTDEAQSRRKDLAEQVTIELVRHSVAEEVLVYPQVEDKISAEEAEHARKEHAEAEETMQRMEKLDADDPAFDDTLATLMREIRQHIAEEEGQMFAHMREVIDQDELRKLGGRVEAFKKVAPTRPHPNVPNEPLPRMATGPAASLFDRMRDLATNRGTDD
jgi:hemerythrin superfamily protein